MIQITLLFITIVSLVIINYSFFTNGDTASKIISGLFTALVCIIGIYKYISKLRNKSSSSTGSGSGSSTVPVSGPVATAIYELLNKPNSSIFQTIKSRFLNIKSPFKNLKNPFPNTHFSNLLIKFLFALLIVTLLVGGILGIDKLMTSHSFLFIGLGFAILIIGVIISILKYKNLFFKFFSKYLQRITFVLTIGIYIITSVFLFEFNTIIGWVFLVPSLLFIIIALLKYFNIIKGNSTFSNNSIFSNIFKFLSPMQAKPIILVILIIETLIISSYFLVPLLYNYIYKNFNSKTIIDPDTVYGDNTEIIKLENNIIEIIDNLDVDWDLIMNDELYKCENANILTEYLIKQGFIASGPDSINGKPVNPNSCNSDSSYTISNNQSNLPKTYSLFDKVKQTFGFSGEKKSFDYAKTYIQTNGNTISNLKRQIKTIKTNTKNKNKPKKLETIVLQKDPIYTDKETTLDIKGNNESIHNIFNVNYAVGAWVFIHEQPPNAKFNNNKFTTILNFGNKPNILFNVKNNELMVSVDNKPLYTTNKIKLQKWNYILINYKASIMDIFINSELVASKNNILPKMNNEKITTGASDGVSGGICNVVYYPNPLGIDEIKLNYKTLKWKNPPVV